MKLNNFVALLICFFIAGAVQAEEKNLILTDPALLKAIGVEPEIVRPDLGVALAQVTAEEEKELSHMAHSWGRCGGFESLFESELIGSSKMKKMSTQAFNSIFSGLEKRKLMDRVGLFTRAPVQLTEDPVIKAAVAQVDDTNIKSWVQWFSAFPTRHHASATANKHVDELKEKIEKMLSTSKLKYSVETITHQRTSQMSLKVRIEGTTRPNEIVVLGGHFDSINSSFFGGSKLAPGADDNASGSSSLIEALRVLSLNSQPERTIEFMWYAAEEVGLWGSAEIAAAYKSAAKDVIGVLQLDMTMYPGAGELTIASMNDFTSAWLRGLLLEINKIYIGATIVDDKCGYGCSDHASWYRQGYPTLMPFESTMNSMNQNIHTDQDTINSKSSFKHAAAFSKIAVVFALQLGNSTLRE